MRIRKTSQYIEGGAGLPSYFTDEIDTGMKWIDGKPIYRKVVTTKPTTVNDWKYTNHGISNLGDITNVYGYVRNSADNTFRQPLQCNDSIKIIINNNNTAVNTSSSNYINVDWYITLEYTKTTD